MTISWRPWTLILALASASSFGQSSLDAGGRRTTSVGYTIVSSIGEIVGVSSNAAPVETVRSGFMSQLTEVASLLVTAQPAAVLEGGTGQLTGKATLDDNTVSLLSGMDIVWSNVSYPFVSVNVSGLLTAAIVYSNTAGAVRGSYLGASSNIVVQVLDNNSDNYGLYAADGIPVRL